ncbi:MAG: hypothetical protein ACO1RX_09435 [Candidatus Sericytochromatia bacterium]
MSTQHHLPVNSRLISTRQHVILRLDQLQRAVLEDPSRFDALEGDRGLNHVRKEVRQLQSALLLAVEDQARTALKRLNRAGKLLDSWQSEEQLRDILALDQHRRLELADEVGKAEAYAQWRALIPRLEAEHERLFNKYQGYFEGQKKDIEGKKSETQKKVKQILPKAEEWRAKLDAMIQIQQQVNFDTHRASNGLVSGLGSLAALTVLGHFSGIWGGWFWGVILGYIVFSHLAARCAYLEGPSIQHLYDFLCERYPLKSVKPFFQFPKPARDEKGKLIPPDPEAPPPRPLRFDATRGEKLARMLQKDIISASSDYGQLERQREEHLNYVQYLEGRHQWCDEQIRRMQQLQGIPEAAPPVEKAETPAPTEELPSGPPVPHQEDAVVVKPAGTIKARPAQKFQPIPAPDRAS